MGPSVLGQEGLASNIVSMASCLKVHTHEGHASKKEKSLDATSNAGRQRSIETKAVPRRVQNG